MEIVKAPCPYCAAPVLATDAGDRIVVSHGDRSALLLVRDNPSKDEIKYALVSMLRQHHEREARRVSDG